jgi:ElaB/YqjD/DUF883 family membrane-anchored ribosome-binding protein
VENAANQASEKVQQATSTAMDKAQEMASSAGTKAEEATAALGQRVQSVAGTIRERGPQEGMLGNASGAVADRLDTAGRYLQEEGLAGMAEDVTELIRRNPIPAMFIGIGIGFMLARLLRR